MPASQIYASDIFTDQERYDVAIEVQEGLRDIWTQAPIQACWSEANAGSDRALSALFLIKRSRNEIDNIAQKRRNILQSTNNPKEIHSIMKKSFTRDDLKRVRKAVTMLPKSMSYCNKLSDRNGKELK